MRFSSILFVFAIALAFPLNGISTEGKQEPNAKLGTRYAARLLLSGNIPKPWQIRAGLGAAPKNLVWPIVGRGIGRGFGSDSGRHPAIDITAPAGTPVRAAAGGLVAYAASTVKGYGKMMLVLHRGGLVTMYAHLSEYKAKPGQWTTRGQIIASTGNTGVSRGPHLHFALFSQGKPIDPAPLMESIPHRIGNNPLKKGDRKK